MKNKSFFNAAIIILFVLLILGLGSIPRETAWAGPDFQTVPTSDVEPPAEPPDGGEDDLPWWRQYIGLICGGGFILLLGGIILGYLLRWWIERGNKNPSSPGTPGDD